MPKYIKYKNEALRLIWNHLYFFPISQRRYLLHLVFQYAIRRVQKYHLFSSYIEIEFQDNCYWLRNLPAFDKLLVSPVFPNQNAM